MVTSPSTPSPSPVPGGPLGDAVFAMLAREFSADRPDEPSTTGTVLGEERLARLLDEVAYGDCTPERALPEVRVLLSAAREHGAAAERERWAETQRRYESLLDLYRTAMHAAHRDPANARQVIGEAFAELDRLARSTS